MKNIFIILFWAIIICAGYKMHNAYVTTYEYEINKMSYVHSKLDSLTWYDARIYTEEEIDSLSNKFAMDYENRY